MPGFLYRMPAGIAGSTHRVEHLTAKQEIITPYGNTGAPSFMGQAMVLDATTGMVRAPTSITDQIYGFLIRSYPTQGGQADQFGGGTPPVAGIVDVMTRGYMVVQLGGTASAVKEGLVYVRALTPGTNKFIGDVEAAADGSNTILLNGLTNGQSPAWAQNLCVFTGPADANGVVEIAFNI